MTLDITLEEIKLVLRVLFNLQERQKQLQAELDFYNAYAPDANYIKEQRSFFEGLRRLDHEVMFLCIDTYSLYEGIQKQKSLITKTIKNNGKVLSEVSKVDDTIICAGIIDENGNKRKPNPEEEKFIAEKVREDLFNKRKKARDTYGITSPKHEDIEKWNQSILDKDTLEQLENYRNEFSHRLNTLERIKIEADINNNKFHTIKDRLILVKTLLDKYQLHFKSILLSTKAEYHLPAMIGYDSLSRIKQKILGEKKE
ncbi:MAG: hypothetical protein EA365_16295 [Gloeocapsa sp. DLM2.Bin57]|nr:MAG: hypothetical protein EA365_16295 [Gloeocapsa sp. DLM2.Bin57]